MSVDLMGHKMFDLLMQIDPCLFTVKPQYKSNMHAHAEFNACIQKYHKHETAFLWQSPNNYSNCSIHLHVMHG